MRRKDREILDVNEKLKIIQKNKVCRISLIDGSMPYIIPLNFGFTFEKNVLNLYFHSSKEGKKIDLIRKNSQACFEMDCDHLLIEGKDACTYGFSFSSIIGTGKIEILDSYKDKIYGLNRVMIQQTGVEKDYIFNNKAVENTVVLKFVVNEFTGKQKAAAKVSE
jgi:nitroimidazol reductase NimA-like FMN-containing flavoprotein (pyridoxamine 5'-phosphate oxidase superfamily)